MLKSRSALSDCRGGFFIGETILDEPAADEVIVKMKAAGICHTDYDSLQWGKPLVLGHEGAGEVFQTGREVNHVKKGDRVVLNWATPCGHCYQCIQGNQNICERNSPVVAGSNGYNGGHATLQSTRFEGRPIERSFNLGTLSEFAILKSSAVVSICSSKLNYASASILGCGVMTGYGSAVNAARVKAGSAVVVIGAGGVGLNVIQGARISGASRIISIDINPAKLEMAKRFGATHTLLVEKEDRLLTHAAEEVKRLTGGRGADYAFECTAIPALGAAPLAMVRNAGTAVQVSGIEQSIQIDMSLFEWDKVYINPLYGKCRPQMDFPDLMTLYDTGKLMLDELITTTYSLDELPKAFDDLLKGKNAKGVILFEENV